MEGLRIGEKKRAFYSVATTCKNGRKTAKKTQLWKANSIPGAPADVIPTSLIKISKTAQARREGVTRWPLIRSGGWLRV